MRECGEYTGYHERIAYHDNAVKQQKPFSGTAYVVQAAAVMAICGT